MNKNFFSVIIPIYNSAKFLKKCVNSIYKQNFNDVEVILPFWSDSIFPSASDLDERFEKLISPPNFKFHQFCDQK